jgi:glutamine amidotransferase
MFAYYGQSSSKIERLFECLKKSAEKDVYFNNNSHPDGWGLVVLTKDKIFHYRSGNPIFTENMPLKLNDEEMIAIFHARQATDKTLVGSQFSHPYVETNENGVLFFAHNGSVDKESLSQELLINADMMVDSELALKFLLRYSNLYNGINDLKNYTKSALNLFLIQIHREKEAELFYLNYVKTRSQKVSSNYYDLYVDKKDGVSVFSSTLSYYCNELGQDKAKYGELTSIGKLKLK